MKTIVATLIILFHFSLFTFDFSAELNATIRYVSKTGRSTPPYTSWETAADSIQKCIDICEYGDTIYVANGVYKEFLRIFQNLTLIGSSMDSTVIDGTGLNDTTIFATAPLTLNSFTIKGKEFSVWGFYVGVYAMHNLVIEKCKIINTKQGILAQGSSQEFAFIKDNFLSQHYSAILLDGFKVNSNYYALDNIILCDNYESWNGIWLSYHGIHHIFRNIILTDKNADLGIYVDWTKRFYIKNNLISGFRRNIFVDLVNDTSYIINNVFAYMTPSDIRGSITLSLRDKAINNIFIHNQGAAIKYGENNYNLFWNNVRNFLNTIPGDSSIYADPMLVNDIRPSLTNNWDYHLQAYSPAIDKGDPSILDPDGSRSDIGMYGGPYGEVYTYQDLAPRPPRNLSAVVDSGRVILKWNKNTEADTSHYNIYRFSAPNFLIDSTKLVGSTKDTSFINIITPTFEKLYYKITCVDRQDNQSQPSEELMVNLTSINEYPSVINDYYLYQNYPNPFNPTTKIGYKLKERGYVKLMVYDIKGERVAVLVNEEKEAGYYEVEIDANVYQLNSRQTGINIPMASGIYLYRIEVIGEGNIPVYTEMRKMAFIK